MYQIDDEIIKKTSGCKSNFLCLKKKNYGRCKVISTIFKEVHFIKCNAAFCEYRMCYADDYICNCPVRKELYNKYGI